MTASPSRVVLDTNILIRAFLNPLGPSRKCLEIARRKEIMLCLSDEAFAEIQEVIDRPFIHKLLGVDSGEQRKYFLDEIETIAYFTDPIEAKFDLPRDRDDAMIIDLAVSSEADFIVTLDRDLLDLMTGFDDASKEFRQRFRHLKIVRPDEFLKIVSETGLSLEP